MLNFICRRLAHSCLVILGVMLLTFVLFQMAAGDPAAAVLGKNPKPLEIENLRRELKSDLPMFYGHWRKSEVYNSADYSKGKVELPDITVEGSVFDRKTHLELQRGGKIKFKRRFEVPEKVLVRITCGGMGELNGKALKESCNGDCDASSREILEFVMDDAGEFLTVSLLQEKGYDPMAYRLFCLQSHYRRNLVFSWENLDNAVVAYEKLVAKIATLTDNGDVDSDTLSALGYQYDSAQNRFI